VSETAPWGTTENTEYRSPDGGLSAAAELFQVGRGEWEAN